MENSVKIPLSDGIVALIENFPWRKMNINMNDAKERIIEFA